MYSIGMCGLSQTEFVTYHVPTPLGSDGGCVGVAGSYDDDDDNN